MNTTKQEENDNKKDVIHYCMNNKYYTQICLDDDGTHELWVSDNPNEKGKRIK